MVDSIVLEIHTCTYGSLTKLVRSRWLYFGLVLFVFMDRDGVEVQKHAKKKKKIERD